MIMVNTFLNIVDNSGGSLGKCLNLLTKSHKSTGKIGDVLVFSLKKSFENKKLQEGSVLRGLVVKIETRIFRYGGVSLEFSSNGIIVLNSKNEYLSTRILSPIAQDLRLFGHTKTLLLAPIII